MPYKDTEIETTIRRELTNSAIEFETHVQFPVRRSFHPADIFLKPNIVIECDGEHFHTRLLCHSATYSTDSSVNFHISSEGISTGWRNR
ncbi:MAG: hypothetical protein ACJ71G_00995 [Nitrososphaeraceae archaeon]